MADQKITGMTAATTPLGGTELVELVQGGVNKQATVQDIADLANPPTTPDLATVLTNGNDASGIPIIGLPTPTVGSEATNKDYVDATVGSVGTPVLGAVVAQGNDTGGVAIIGLPTPTVGSEATNKDYVDGVASGSAHLADYTTVNDAAPLAANCNNLKEPKFYTEIANNRTIDFTNVRAVNNANQYVVVFWVFKKTVAGDIVITLDADSSQFTNKDLAADTAATAYTLTGASNSYFKLTAVFHGESSGSIVWWNLVTTSAGGGGGTWGSITGTLSSQTDLQAALDAKLALAGGTMSGAIAMGNQKITGLAAATTNGDAVRYQQLTSKAEVDSQVFTGTPSLPTGTTGVTQSAGDNSTKLATTAYADAVGSSPNVRKRLGSIYNKTLVAGDSTAYTDTSPQTTFTFTSGGITASGGNNDALNYLEYTSYYTSTHLWKRVIRFVPTSDGNGVGIGIESGNGKQLGRIICTGASKGKVLIDTYRSGTLTNRVTSTPALTYTNTTDTIELTFEKFYTTYRITAQVVGTPASVVSAEWVDTLTYPTVGSVWQTGRPSIYHFGGSQTITVDKFEVNELVQNEIAVLSDSIAAGSYASSADGMWAVILGKWVNKGVGLLAGGGNLTANYTNMSAEFLALKPRIAIWTLGVNDAINAVSLGTTQGNVLSFIQNCYSNGIQPILVEIMQAGSGNATAINAINSWMSGLGYVKYVSTAAMYSGSSLLAAYDAGDGIHLNAVGNQVYAKIIANAIRGAVPVNDFTSVTNGTNAVAVTNTNSGTSSSATVQTISDTATGYFSTYSSTYSVTGYANKTFIQNTSAGVVIMSSGGSGIIQFVTASATIATGLRMTIGTASIDITVPITLSGNITHSVNLNSNQAAFNASNTNTGTAAGCRLIANCGTTSTYLVSTSQGYSPTGGFKASDGLFITNGLRCMMGTDNASGTVEFAVGSSYAIRMILTAAGALGINGSNTPTAYVDVAAANTSRASIRIRSGVAPTSPNDGDLWYDGTDLKFRQSGTTKTVTLV